MNADELDPKPAIPVSTPVGTEPPHSGDEMRESATPKRASSGIAVLALLLAALSSAAVAWMWWQAGDAQQQHATQLQMQEQQFQAGLQRLEQALASAQNTASQQSNSLSGELQARLQNLESTQTANEDFRAESSAWRRSAQAAMEEYQTRMNSVDERLRTLTARSAQSDSELELEEIDYLLRMAQERLQLFGDTRNADRALQLADHQVVAFDNPMFIALRREIAAARQALAATDVPDMAALAAELDNVQDSLATLPFKTSDYEPVAQEANSDTDPSWWQRLKNSLSGLITVRRVTDDELDLPVLADQQALRQRAWLQLEQARLAALSREQEIYQDALKQAEATITRWFAADNAEVRLTLSGLQALQQRNVNPPMPDISGPWNTLRSIRGAGLSPTVAQDAAPNMAPTVSPTAASTVAPTETTPTSIEDAEEPMVEEFVEPVDDSVEEPVVESIDGASDETGNDSVDQPSDVSGEEEVDAATNTNASNNPVDNDQ